MNATRIAASAMTACLALGACAQGGAPATRSEGTPSATFAQPGVTSPEKPVLPAPTRPATPTPPPGSTPSPPTRITGTVSAGVEPGCLLLDGYLLVGGPPDLLRPGVRVTVTGRAQPDLITTCQQGTPFLVETASRS